MLSYKMDFSFCACKPGFVKSSHNYNDENNKVSKAFYVILTISADEIVTACMYP